MASTKKLLEALINVLFAKTPAEAAKTVLKAAVEQLPSETTQPTWEQLFLGAFDTAVEAMRPQLQRYASPDGEVGLDKERLRAALQGDLAIHDLAESDLLSEAFQDRLAEELFERDALYIGGNRLSPDDTRQLVELLVTQHAPAQFKALIEHNEDAFRQALRREAHKTNVQLDEVQRYLHLRFDVVVARLEEIHEETQAIRVGMENLPEAVADELEARGLVRAAAQTVQRQVFISYARADHADEGRAPDCFVQKLYRALKDEGFTPWLDHHDMPSRGTPFPKELARAIERSERFLAVCGPAYSGSEWAQKEQDYAQACCIAITPVLFEGDLETSVPADIQRDHVIDMRAGFEQTWPELLTRLREPVDLPGQVRHVPGELPELRPNDLPRPALFERARHSLLNGQDNLEAVSGTQALTAMYAAGGIGKSTLAARLAFDCQVRRAFPDGVIWVRLGEHLRDADTVRLKVGTTFGLPAKELSGADGPAYFARALQDKDALIILDDVWSVEQVHACRVHGQDLRYLITTRRADLGDTLGLPDENQIKMEYLTVDEGVELIARRLGLDPAADYSHKDIHRKIVETLGGHTQAIDLAAAQLRPRDRGGNGLDYAPTLLERLKKGDNVLFDLLKRGVAADRREDNLLKSLSVSYAMLPTAPVDLQRCFRLLGAFADGGSFDVAAVAAVWEEDDPERARLWLNELKKHSLVIESQEIDRYSVHVLIHAAARVLLNESGEADAAARRHAAHYRAKAEYWTFERKHVSPLAPDIEQYRQAFRWARAHDQRNLVRFVIAAWQFLLLMSFLQDLREWLETALQIAEETDDRAGKANTLQSLGDLESRLGNVEAARQLYKTALPLYEAEQDRLGKANTLKSLGDLSRLEGDYETAADLFQQAADLYRAIESWRDEAVMKAMFAQLRLDQGQSREAIRLIWEALQYFEAQQLLGDIRVARNILRGFVQRIPDFATLWQEVTGQPMPEWLRPARGYR